MSNLQRVVTIAVPAVTVLFGLLWFFRRKQPASSHRSADPPDKGVQSPVHERSSNDRNEVSNGTAGKTSSKSEAQTASQKPSEKIEVVDKNVEDNLKSSLNSVVTERGDASKVEKEESVEKNIENEVEEDLVKPSFSEPSYTELVKNEKLNQDIELPVTVEPSEQDIITPKTNTTLQSESVQNAASHGTEKDKIECAINDSVENVSQVNISSSPNLPVADSTEELNAPNSDLKNLTDANSVLEDQIILENQEPLSRSWYEDIPEDSSFPDLNNSLPSDTSKTILSNSENDRDNCNKMDEAVIYSRENLNQDAASNSQTKSVNKNVHATNQADKTPESSNSDSSSNCDNLSEASNDSGKGGSVHENVNQSPPDEDRIFEFNIPSDMCGLFIGRSGKTIKMISQQSGTKIRLQNNPYTPKYQICVVEGTQNSIDCACSIIKRKFPAIKFPGADVTPGGNTMIMPEIMQLSLPEGVSVDIVVSSIVDAGRIFVQQPTHPSYTSLDRLNTFMNQCYMRDGTVPDIPRPIESGVICAAPMLNGWYRAQIMATHDDTDESDIKYVDYGGYSRVANSVLKQIRSDFMTLPFEAVECYMANITPLDTEQFFSSEAAVVLEELTQGQMLQARVVGHAEDGIPFVEIFQLLRSHQSIEVNREMVQRGVVRWIEQLE